MIVKVCGITNETDAQAAVEAGADALGFNFWPRSPRFVTPQPWMFSLPVTTVGIYVGEARIVNGLSVAQIYGAPEPSGVRIWRAVKPGEPRRDAEAFVMDVSEGTGRTFDWSLAAGATERIVLAGGLGPENVAEAIRIAQPWGVDACSRLESAPGKKDIVKMREFIAAAKQAVAV